MLGLPLYTKPNVQFAYTLTLLNLYLDRFMILVTSSSGMIVQSSRSVFREHPIQSKRLNSSILFSDSIMFGIFDSAGGNTTKIQPR